MKTTPHSSPPISTSSSDFGRIQLATRWSSSCVFPTPSSPYTSITSFVPIPPGNIDSSIDSRDGRFPRRANNCKERNIVQLQPGLTLTARTFVIYEFPLLFANLKAGQFAIFANPNSRIFSKALRASRTIKGLSNCFLVVTALWQSIEPSELQFWTLFVPPMTLVDPTVC